MVANAIEKRVAITVEGSFADDGAIDYDALVAPEGLLAVTEVQTENLKREYIDNKNITVRAADVHPKIRGLRSGATSQIGSYIYGARSGHAAAGAQSARDLLDVVLQSTIAGELDGYAADITGGVAAAPTVDGGHGDNLSPWSWGFFWDDDAGTGEFRKIQSIADGGAGDDTLTMAPGHDLSFTPDVADTMYAVRQHFPHWPAMEDHAHASHSTLAMMLAGAHAEDFFDLRGVKPDLQMGAIEQGAPAELTFPLKLPFFFHDEITLPGPDLAYALQGSPGTVVGAGVRTRVWLAEAGATLAPQEFWGAITPNLAIEHAPITGPNGIEGVHGWGLAESSYKSGTVELHVPFSRDWRAAAEAGTEYHLLIQVGNAITDGVWGLYFPRLSFNEDAMPAEDDNRRRQSTLSFIARERQGFDISGLGEDEGNRALAKFEILRIG